MLNRNVKRPQYGFAIARWLTLAFLAMAIVPMFASTSQPGYDAQGTGRRPLVIVSGVTEQLPTGDYMSSVGGVSTNANAPAAGDVQTTTETVTTTMTNAGQVQMSGSITPTTLTGTRQDNYSPSGLATAYVIDQTVTTATTITGLVAQPTGTVINFRNVATSTANLTLTSLDANSLTANQFQFPGSASWILPPGSSLMLRYNGTNWRVTTTLEQPTITVDGTATLNGAQVNGAIITPAALTTTTNNYGPTGLSNASLLVQSATAAVTITGLVAQPTGTVITILNPTTSAGSISFAHLSGSSTAANQFRLPSSTAWTIDAGMFATFRYSGSDWQLVGGSFETVPNFTVNAIVNLSQIRIQNTQTYSTTGSANNVALNSSTTVFEYTGAGTATITGLTGTNIGRLLIVYNNTSNSVTLSNQSASSSSSSRLQNIGNVDVTLSGLGSSAMYVYDPSTNGPWHMIGLTTTTRADAVSLTNTANRGTITLSGGTGTATVQAGTICTCSDTTATNACKPTVASTTLTITGTGTDVINYICI